MNTIHIDNNSSLTNIIISEDTNIFYTSTSSNITIEILNDCKVFEYIKDSNIEINYKMKSSLYLNRFVIDSSVKSIIDLDKEGNRTHINLKTIPHNNTFPEDHRDRG